MSEPLYYAKDGAVRQRQVKTVNSDGTTSYTFGFTVCQVDPLVEGGAEAVAEIMNRGERVPAMEDALRRARQCLIDAVGTLAGTAVVDARRTITAINAALAKAGAAGGEG